MTTALNLTIHFVILKFFVHLNNTAYRFYWIYNIVLYFYKKKSLRFISVVHVHLIGFRFF